MSNGMDLPEITQRWKDSTAFMSGGVPAGGITTGKVVYTFNNIFVQGPVQMCQGTEERPDTNIKVSLTVASTIAFPFGVSYTVTGPKNIRRVLVLLNKQQVGMFEYAQ